MHVGGASMHLGSVVGIRDVVVGRGRGAGANDERREDGDGDDGELTSEDCRPLRGMIEEESGKDGSHDGAPWFKNEMGGRCMGVSRKGLLSVDCCCGSWQIGHRIPDVRSRRESFSRMSTYAVTEESLGY